MVNNSAALARLMTCQHGTMEAEASSCDEAYLQHHLTRQLNFWSDSAIVPSDF